MSLDTGSRGAKQHASFDLVVGDKVIDNDNSEHTRNRGRPADLGRGSSISYQFPLRSQSLMFPPPQRQNLPSKSVVTALPTVRDYTTDQLGPEGDEYIRLEYDEHIHLEYDERGEEKVTSTGHLLSKSQVTALPTVRDHTTDQLGPEGDEYIPREYDERGEKKVTSTGHLLGDREYNCRTFFVPNRGNKLFILARECARVKRYRDSYALFDKNRCLYKIIATDAEKEDLIRQEIIPYSYRSRQISILTAKSAFRQFGSRVVANGRRVRDDYWEAKARKQGFTEDDLAEQKKPGAAKGRDTAAAGASASTSMNFSHEGEIVSAQTEGSFDTHAERQAALPGITLALEKLGMIGEYSNIQRPREEVSSHSRHDRIQGTQSTEFLTQTHRDAENIELIGTVDVKTDSLLERHRRTPQLIDCTKLTQCTLADEGLSPAQVAQSPCASDSSVQERSVSQQQEKMLPPSLKSIDWTTELARAVGAAYEAAYGSASTSPSLLLKLYSIFDDESFLASESISDVDEESFISGVSQHGQTGRTSSASGNLHDACRESTPIPSVSGIGGYTGAGQRSDQSSEFPRVKATSSNLHPSKRVIRRLRCHFNARNSQKYCVTRATGNKYHVCAKAGYLTVTHLKQHNKSTHMSSQCTRCGRLFDLAKDQKAHARLEPNKMCHVKPEEEWPGSAEAESINDKVQERIRKKISARGYQELESSTKDALVLWVSANITEYVGDNPTSQDKQELKNWYLIWLALFPGIPVPSQPFFDGPSEASAEDERFLQVFQSTVEDRMARQQMTSMPPGLVDEILERIRETQVIMRTMSQAVQNNTPRDFGQDSPPMNSTQLLPSLSSSESIRSRRPEHNLEGPAPKRRRDDSQPLPVASSSTEGDMTALETLPQYSQYNSGPQLGTAPFQNVMGLNLDSFVNDPWSASAPRFSDMGQPSSHPFPYSESDPLMQPFLGESSLVLEQDYWCADTDGHAEIYDLAETINKPNGTPRARRKR